MTMVNKNVIVVGLVMLLFGFGVGQQVANYQQELHFDDISDYYRVMYMSAQAKVALKALQELRGGKTDDAIEVLEELVDDMTLSLQPPLKAQDKMYSSIAQYTILEVRDYRDKFPRNYPNPMTKVEMDKALHPVVFQEVQQKFKEASDKR